MKLGFCAMKQKRVFHYFRLGDLAGLENALNAMSRQGWQVLRAGRFLQVYTPGEGACLHRFGCSQHRPGCADEITWLAAQERAGWTLVTRKGPWLLFRRPAEPRDQGSGIRDQGSGVRDQGSGIRDQGVGAHSVRPQAPLPPAVRKTSPACRGGGPASRPVEGSPPSEAPASEPPTLVGHRDTVRALFATRIARLETLRRWMLVLASVLLLGGYVSDLLPVLYATAIPMVVALYVTYRIKWMEDLK